MRNYILKTIRFFLSPLRLIPLQKNKVVLIAFYNKYVLDIKAIGEYLRINYPNSFTVYLGTTKKNIISGNLKTTNIRSIFGIYHLATAGVVITSIHVPTYVPYRDDQIIIDTWHGNGIKKSGVNLNYFEDINCFLSYSAVYTQKKVHESFKYSGLVLNSGMPKNDIFYRKDIDVLRKEIRSKLQLNEQKIVLYAPTFRKGFKEYQTCFDFNSVVNELCDKFGCDWIALYRSHPSTSNMHLSNNQVMDVTSYDDMQELLAIADVLITDYSSSVWDFGLQNKPIFIYAPDLKEYEANDRGFITPLSEWPYPIAVNNEELLSNIKSFDTEKYCKKMEEYYCKSGSYEKGTATKNVVDYILSQE